MTGLGLAPRCVFEHPKNKRKQLKIEVRELTGTPSAGRRCRTTMATL